MSVLRKKKVDQVHHEVLHGEQQQLVKHLGVKDLTAFGIAAIVGAGIFSTIGKASADGGPGVILLFLFTALACSFAAFAYAEFSSLIPVSGSAYTYSYVAFGEIFAWIIGWALIMEYAIGNVTVAISWSDYFSALIEHSTPFKIPEWLCMDFFSAKASYFEVLNGFQLGKNHETLSGELGLQVIQGYEAFRSAPVFFGQNMVFDLPALFINLLITWLVYRGIKESRNASNIMVLIKLAIVLLVIFVGAFYVNTENWNPFLPNGLGGLLSGISAVFFAYIGFDAISTTAEECKNPQRDLPRGILYSILICTVLYVAIALVVTGMVHHSELAVGDPLAYVFSKISDLQWLAGIVAVSAVVAMASVMLVFQLGQPRIWMSMSRDGLLPPAFSRIHRKYKTPSFSTLITGLMVALPLFFLDINIVTDICSAGTLFAFVMVCGGVLKLRMDPSSPPSKFKTPYLNSKYITGTLLLMSIYLMWRYEPDYCLSLLNPKNSGEFAEHLPMYVFFLGFVYLSWLSYKHNFSLIPVLGLLSCFYMLSQLGYKNWLYFSGWLLLGLCIYFVYGRKHSKLAQVKH